MKTKVSTGQALSINPVSRDPALIPALIALWVMVLIFVIYPVLRLMYITFFSEGKFSLGNLFAVLSNWYDRAAIYNSLFLGVMVAISGVILGFIFAYAVTRTNLPKPLKYFFSAVTALPLVSPPFTSSIAITLSLGPNGFLLKELGLPNFVIYGFWGTWLSETLTYFPVAFLTLTAVLMAIDSNIEDAALSLGASRLKTFWRVTMPLATPGLANAFLLLFASSLSDFATPLVLAGHTFPILPTQAYLQITGLHDLKGGATLSFILIIPAMIVYVVQRFWVGRRNYVTVTGKAGVRTSPKGLSKVAEWAIVIVGLVTSFFIIQLYAIIFLGSFVKVWGVDHTLTLDNFHYVFTWGEKAIWDTIIIASIATPLGGLIAVGVGYFTTRKRFWGNRLLEFVSLLNYALPGTVIGIAYVIAFNTGPLVLTGTMAIIVAAYVFRYDATGIRTTIASLHQIDSSLEEAALSLGATPFATFRKITLPLILPAVISGMRFLFVRAMTAISATIFLVSVGWTLLTTRILECITAMQFGQASAFSVVLILIVFIMSGVIALLFRIAYPQIAR